MRIIAGTLKNRVLPSPPGVGTRPTSDRLRESVFSVLEFHAALQNSKILDLCSGTGALAFEALSRGASSALVVDSSSNVCRSLRETADAFGVSEKMRIMKATVPECIEHLTPEQFDVVFVDPPYALKVCNTVLHRLLQCSVAAPGALLVFEHGDQEHMIPTESVEQLKSIEMGLTVADIFRYLAP